jgi:type IV secretion system protein VirB2
MSIMESIKSLFTYKNLFILLSLIAFMCFVNAGWCGTTSGGDMPWESGLEKLKKSITGPVATGIALAGIVGCGCGLAFGGEMNQVMKTMIVLVIVVCVIILANKLLAAFTDSGAVLPADSVNSALSVEKNASVLDVLHSGDHLTSSVSVI